MRTRTRQAVLLAAVAAVALVAGACGGEEPAEEPPAAEKPAEEAEEEGHEEEAVEVPPDAQHMEVVGTEFAFDPAEFTVEGGIPVAVTFHNEGEVDHDWALRTADGEEVEDAHVHAVPGEETVAVFTLEPGTYEAWCTLAGHYEAGMKGEVVAE